MNFLRTHLNWYALCHKQVAKQTYYLILVLSFLLFLPVTTYAKGGKTIDEILKLPTAPSGVVIEIATSGENNLEWALPRAKEYIEQLRKTFPKLPIAIVTHGKEQFSLTKDKQQKNSKVHQLVKSFGAEDVPVHVCETYAGWRGLTADDFPSYVNVAAEGPAQVKDYINFGYELIVIKKK